MSSAPMTLTAPNGTSVPVAGSSARGGTRAGLIRWSRPLLGLLVPVVLALGWEFAVYAGLSNGRLLPPPSVILHTLADLAATGELW